MMSLAEEEDLEPYVRRRVEKSEERKRAMGMSEEVLDIIVSYRFLLFLSY